MTSLSLLLTRLRLFQSIYTAIIFTCLCTVWIPTSPTDHPTWFDSKGRSLGHLFNATSEYYNVWFYSGSKTAFFVAQCTVDTFTASLRVHELTCLEFFTRSCRGVAALASAYPHLLCWYLPATDEIGRRRLCSGFRIVLIPLVISSISNQLASAFIHRPFELIFDYQFDTLLIVQMIGFLLRLFSSFVFGAIYASSYNVNHPIA
jgi:hypothetical protein